MPRSLERHQPVIVSPKSTDTKILVVSLGAAVACLQARSPPLTSIVDYNCEDMASDFSITVSQLMIWNTWLGSDCDITLYANLGYEDTRAICIGVNASVPTGTASAPPSAIPTVMNAKTS